MIFFRRCPGICYTYRYCLCLSAIISVLLIYFLFRLKILCLDSDARDRVNEICEQFENGVVTGNLCSRLCHKTDVRSISCYSFKSNNRVKFKVKWKNIPVVFKSPPRSPSPFHWYDNGEITYPTEQQFLATLRAMIFNRLNILLPLNTIKKLVGYKASYAESDITETRKEMDALSNLVEDKEFLILSVFSGNEVFPKIFGTCGVNYAIEYAEPLKHKSSLLAISDNVAEWIQNLQTSAQIMEIIKKLDNEFTEPIYLCNMQLEHFGNLDDESLRYTNLKHVYPKSIINRILRNISCNKDDDCDFYECRSKCNALTKTCSVGVVNNNFQVACEKIFLGWRRFNKVIVPGLLVSQHTPSDLAAVLRQCANPGHELGKPRMSPEELITKRMYELVVEIEETVVSQMSV